MPAVTATIKFVQGVTVGVAGRALEGTTGTAVTVSNDTETNVVNRTYTMLSVPIGSVVPTGTIGTGVTASFTPDVSGCYRVRVTVTDGGVTTSSMVRVFGVENARGWLVPAFDGTAEEHNFDGQIRGWAGTISVEMLDGILKDIADNAFTSTLTAPLAGDAGKLVRAKTPGGLDLEYIAGTTGQSAIWNGTAVTFGAVDLANASAITGKLPLANIAQIPTDSLLGRDTAGSGDIENITLDTTLVFNGSLVLGRAAISGDIDIAAGSNTSAIATGVIVNADINASAAIALSKLATQAALSVVANATNGTAVPTAVAAASDFQVFRRSGTALAFGSVNLASSNAVTGLLPFANIANGSARSVFGRASNTAGVQASIVGGGAGTVLVDDGTTLSFTTIGTTGIADNSVTFAKIQDIPTDSLIGRDTTGTGDPESITLNATLEFTGSQVLQRAALTGDVTASAGSNTTAIAAGVIVDGDINSSAAISISKFANATATSLLGRSANTAGAYADIQAGTNGFVYLRRTNTVTAALLIDENVDAAAAIAGTKINPDFGAQTVITTGGMRIGTNPASSGSVRIANDFSFSWRNGLNTGNVVGIRVNTADGVLVGEALAASVSLVTSGASIVIGTNVEISGGSQLRFDNAVVSPQFIQEDNTTASATGQAFMIQAQNATGTTSTGGTLQLRSGTGTTAAGPVRFYNGASNNVTFHPTGIDAAIPFGFVSTMASPDLGQNSDATAGVTGDQFTIHAQDVTGTGTTTGGILQVRAGNSTNNVGGNLDLRSGAGASATQAGTFQARIGSAIFMAYPGNVVPSSDGSAFLRAYHNSTVLSGRDSTNTANRSLIRWGTSTDTLIVGATTYATLVSGDDVTMGNTADTWLQVKGSTNRIVMGFGAAQGFSFGASLVEFGATPATNGNIRWGHNMSLQGRDNANANNRNGVRWGATTDTWQFGDVAVATDVLGSVVRIGDSTTMVETVVLATNREILSLMLGADLTTTQMPASTGDKVVFLADATTAPANGTNGKPVGGSIIHNRSALGVMTMGEGGVETVVGPKGGGDTRARKFVGVSKQGSIATSGTTEQVVVSISMADINATAFGEGTVIVSVKAVGRDGDGSSYVWTLDARAVVAINSSGFSSVTASSLTALYGSLDESANEGPIWDVGVSTNVLRLTVVPHANHPLECFGIIQIDGDTST